MWTGSPKLRQHGTNESVVKLYGACHIRSPRFFVYELVPKWTRSQQQSLGEDSNGASMWMCLYEVALGLQYLLNQDGAHCDLRSENMFVGADLVTKLCGVRTVQGVLLTRGSRRSCRRP